MTEKKEEKILVAASAAYIALVTLANLGSLRIITLLGLSLDGGTLLYPFSFTARDMLHKKCGASMTRFTIWLAAGINLLLFGFVWLVGVLPADLTVGVQTAYSEVLAPGIRLVLASVVAMTVAELLDTVIYSAVRRYFGIRRQYLRVLFSNLVSVPLDSALFVIIAFAGRFELSTLIAVFVSNIIIKYAVTLLSLGSIYLVRDDAD